MASVVFCPVSRPEERDARRIRSSGRLAGAMGLALLGGLAEGVGGSAPFGFAALLILGLGLPHGASDHLVAMGGRSWRAAPGRLTLFLALYAIAVVATLLFWRVASGATLALFLLLSAVHFAIDDVAGDPWRRLPERAARGLMPITLPALLHPETLSALFAALSTPEDGRVLAHLAAELAPFVLVLAGWAMLLRLRRGEREPATEIALATLALLVFSPLVGFALVFALVHSRGQTRERMAGLGLKSFRTYLRRCAPTLLGATLLFAGLAALLAEGRAPGLGALFIGLSALTVPHMLVTPLFERNARPRDSLPPARS